MKNIYERPLRVYIVLGALAIWGVISGFNLPVSLFPNSSQAVINISIPFGHLSSQQFFDAYGKKLESELQGLKVDSVNVKLLTSDYGNKYVNYNVKFNWGVDPNRALTEVKNAVNSQLATVTDEIRRGIEVNTRGQNRGFFAISFYSPLRSLDELHALLNPIVTPVKSKISDAGNFTLWNPKSKEISVALIPERMAQNGIKSTQVQSAINQALVGLNGGNLKIGENDYNISLPKKVITAEQLKEIKISNSSQHSPIFLKDIANVKVDVSEESNQKFKTSGVESLILFASPKEGGNIKKMSDEILNQMNILKSDWPEDVQFKILVNPSVFIDSSVKSVVHEVLLAAFLAVIVLFIFIGSLKNVLTAAIEIPLSLLLAFILMKFAGMNLNLISLGGLALSAGMNVDASVVVLENIVRHLEMFQGKLGIKEKVGIVVNAVNEVKLPIIASTLASLVVFLPLIFTEGLTHALLGDLAKAVIFSHGLSAIVALILVPTIRIQLLSKGHQLDAHSPIEGWLKKLELFYQKTLKLLIERKTLQIGVILAVILILPILAFTLIPKLEKEIVGKPDSDWLIVGIDTSAFSKPKQLESEVDRMEEILKKNMGEEINYTFTQLFGSGSAMVMVRLKDKRKIESLIEKSEQLFKNTSELFYWVESWNPSEFRIPNPPQYRLELLGGNDVRRMELAQDIKSQILEKGIFDNIEQSFKKEREIRVQENLGQEIDSSVLAKDEMAHTIRVLTSGVYADVLIEKDQELPVYLRVDGQKMSTIDEIKSFPIGFDGKIVPMSALANISLEDRSPRIYREDQKSMSVITATFNKVNLSKKNENIEQANKLIDNIKAKNKKGTSDDPIISVVDPNIELNESLDQLKFAIATSIFLVFIIMVIQLGDVVHSLLVLVAIPLGFIGVILSLFIFKSTLSLNSGLGTILLNGITVANSIILVDFIRKLHLDGKNPKDATIEAAGARVRPILMTSLTTVLGMFPVALGLGEGGKILQPLGIAVCGGLWVSTLLTLYLVPLLQYLYLNRKGKS